MKFGIREICDVVLRAKATMKLGTRTFYKNEPVLYFDTLKTSSLEGASTTVYATGGRGNTRLVAWEGERTLTFTMEDALISPESFSILSGAGLIGVTQDAPIYVHTTSQIEIKEANTIELPEPACWNKYAKDDQYFHQAADIFIMATKDGEISAEPCIPAKVDPNHTTVTCYGHDGRIDVGDVVLVDYYVKRTGNAQLIEITADKFGGNYYLEASTLFRRESDGVDMPAEFIIPNCKVQSNFTFTMAASGDPSTFTFTMDAFPDYTKFDRTHKVLAALQVITDESDISEEGRQPCIDMGSAIEVMGQDDTVSDYGDKPISELYYPNVEITYPSGSKKGVVTGTFKPVTEWEDLPEVSGVDKPSTEKPQYFFALNLDPDNKGTEKYLNKGFRFTKATAPGAKGTVSTKASATKDEMFWVLNITTNKYFKFETSSASGTEGPWETICELDFTNAALEPYEAPLED